jgi:hypothetical protein
MYTYACGILAEGIPVIFIDNSENRDTGIAFITVESVVASNKFLIICASLESAI